MKLSKIAELLNGELFGEDIEVVVLSNIESPADGSLVVLSSKKMSKYADNSKIAAIVCFESVKREFSVPSIFVKDDKMVLVKLLEVFYPKHLPDNYISNNAFISPTASVSKDCRIEDFVYIGENSSVNDGSIISSGVKIGRNVAIGKRCLIYPNVVIYDDTKIGDNVILHANCTVGADGYGYVNLPDRHVKIPQVGNVMIEDDVEIGANSCIDRGTLSSTIIGKGTKIDNLVQIAHNTVIGKNCLIVGHSGIAGSVTLGDYVIIAGQVGIADHVSICSNVIITAHSGVIDDIDKPGVYSGNPAIENRTFLRNTAVYKELYNLKKTVSKLVEGK